MKLEQLGVKKKRRTYSGDVTGEDRDWATQCIDFYLRPLEILSLDPSSPRPAKVRHHYFSMIEAVRLVSEVGWLGKGDERDS